MAYAAGLGAAGEACCWAFPATKADKGAADAAREALVAHGGAPVVHQAIQVLAGDGDEVVMEGVAAAAFGEHKGNQASLGLWDGEGKGAADDAGLAEEAAGLVEVAGWGLVGWDWVGWAWVGWAWEGWDRVGWAWVALETEGVAWAAVRGRHP